MAKYTIVSAHSRCGSTESGAAEPVVAAGSATRTTPAQAETVHDRIRTADTIENPRRQKKGAARLVMPGSWPNP
jgi:triosephosphate isomerase